MRKSIIVIFHIGFWLCFFLIMIMILAAVFHRNPIDYRIPQFVKSVLIFAALPAFLSFYSFYLILFPRFLKNRRFLTALVYGISSIQFCAISTVLLLHLVGGAAWDRGKSDISYTGQWFAISFISLASGVVALVIRGFITWYNELKLKELLQQKTHQMELELVKSQLDPHFLFNTINNIDVLVLKDPEEASKYLNRLSEILRFILYETKTESVPLEKEIKYIEKYIELQKIRTANKNYIHLHISGPYNGKTIAPMIFIPYIENAFKHATNKKVKDAIIVQIEVSNKSILFVCQNKFDQFSESKVKDVGLGNELIKKRLELTYQDRHSINVESRNGLYSVTLEIFDE